MVCVCSKLCWENEKWECGMWPHLLGRCFQKGREDPEKNRWTGVEERNFADFKMLPWSASGYLISEFWDVHDWVYLEDTVLYTPSSSLCILWMYSSKTKHVQKKHTEQKRIACWVFRWIAWVNQNAGEEAEHFTTLRKPRFPPQSLQTPLSRGVIVLCLCVDVTYIGSCSASGFFQSPWCLGACSLKLLFSLM